MQPSHITLAERVYKRIVNRVAHIEQKLRQAVDILLERPVRSMEDPNKLITTAAFVRHLRHWQFLTPEEPEHIAALLKLFGERYVWDESAWQVLRVALGANDDAVQHAYLALGGQAVVTEADAVAELPEPFASTVQPANDLLDRLEWRYLVRGEVLFRQGDPSDAVYLVVDGRLQGVIVERDGDEIEMTVHPGESIGEEAIVSGSLRAATVRALRDTDLVYLRHERYEQLVMKYPRGMVRLGLQMVQRMQRIAGVVASPQTCQSVVVLAASDGVGTFTDELTHKLQQLAPTLRLHPDRLGELMPAHLVTDIEGNVDDYDFVDWLQAMEAQFAFILYEGLADFPNWTRRAIEQADRIVVVGRRGDDPTRSPIEDILDTVSYPELIPPLEFVLVHERRALEAAGTMTWLEPRNAARHHHVALGDGKSMDRLIRFLRGKAVGVVFGGGGVRAAAHVGAIQALQEAGYHADVVGGTSSGAIVAAMYALEIDLDEMLAMMRDALLRREVLVNPTIPIVSLSTGFRLSQAYERIFGDLRLEDLWTTCFTISANMTQTKQSVNQFGLLRDAVRFSTSIAGVYPPAPDINGDIHIDGGVINNTPADVMREIIGPGLIFASDLGFTLREKVYHNYGNSLSGERVLWHRLNPFLRSLHVPNIMTIMMRANALASINTTEEQMRPADLIIRQPVAGYGLFDFDQFDSLRERGYENTKAALTKFEATASS